MPSKNTIKAEREYLDLLVGVVVKNEVIVNDIKDVKNEISKIKEKIFLSSTDVFGNVIKTSQEKLDDKVSRKSFYNTLSVVVAIGILLMTGVFGYIFLNLQTLQEMATSNKVLIESYNRDIEHNSKQLEEIKKLLQDHQKDTTTQR